MATLELVNNYPVLKGSVSPDSVNQIWTRFKGTDIWHQTIIKVGNGLLDTSRLGIGDFEMHADDGTIIIYNHNRAISDGTGKNWSRWIYASICQHFDLNKPKDSMIFYDGERFKDSKPGINQFCLKMEGPYYKKLPNRIWQARVLVGIDTKSYKSDSDAQFQLRKFLDEMASIFTSIPIFRYGDGPDDDATYIDCMTLEYDWDSYLMIKYMGQRGASAQMFHMASIELAYNIKLRN